MRQMFFDFETFSSVSLFDCGAYKYFESPDFEILLLAYAFGDEEPKVVDLARGEAWPEDFLSALNDPEVEMWAHNAVFERRALKSVGVNLDINKLHCSLAKAAYCSLPLSLAGVSEALELKEMGKKATGRALIQYFSVPCRPTKANGGRLRNMPDDAHDKWEEFKAYIKYDVISEREIVRRLGHIKFPEIEREIWLADQHINDTGILIDQQMAARAIALDSLAGAEARAEVRRRTGLDNPNSVAQLKGWLAANGLEAPSLGKLEVREALKDPGLPEEVRAVLEGRQELAKTSVRKYAAMLKCAADDGRAHGLFQYYGAPRTGRWAGRLIQLQNLPQTHMGPEALAQARGAVKYGTLEDLKELAPNGVPALLSELVRTAFVAPKGKKLCVLDFSAVEARVLSWLAQEEWRINVFNSHGKIYEASASAMFGVPVDQIKKTDPIRFRAKCAELALGYGGSEGALSNIDKDRQLDPSEFPEIVRKWRAANKNIIKFWHAVNEAAVLTVRAQRGFSKEVSCLRFSNDGESLVITLPSGRSLFYRNPRIRPNRFGQDGIIYDGLTQANGWGPVETYGGKLTENITQAVARDLLGWGLIQVTRGGYDVVMHVHDELVAEVPEENAEGHLKICEGLMERVPEWTGALPLPVSFKASGFLTDFYYKG